MANLEYRRHIDGLRAIAVLAVVAYHAGVPWLQGGFVGVDVFFVISGFLITGLLLREFKDRGDISLVGFYERRVRRLAPALLLVLGVTLALGAVFLEPVGGEQQGLAKSAIATLLLVSNLYFAHTTGDYFDSPAAAQPLLHTWSLSVEEQFYLVWPTLLLLAARWARRKGVEVGQVVATLLVLVFAISLVLSIITTPTHQGFAFFGSPTRAWEFASGGLVFVLASRWTTPIPLAQPIAGLGLLAVLYATATFDADAMPFPGWRAAIPVLGSAALLLGCEHARDGIIAKLLSVRPMVAIGLLSYSLYLWHWPLLVITRLHTLDEISPAGIAAVCVTSLLLAWLTYRFIEDPIRHKRVELMATRSLTFRSGFAGVALLIMLAAGLGAVAKLGWTGGTGSGPLQTALAGIRGVRISCTQATPYDGQLLQRPDCEVPEGDAIPNIVIWGDSHAAHYVPALSEYVRRHGLTLRIRYMPECPPLQGYSPTLVGINRRPGCEQFNRDVLAEVSRLAAQRHEIIVIASHWSAYVSNPSAAEAARRGLRDTLNGITSAGGRAIVVAPTPDFSHEVPACLARREVAECTISRSEAERRRAVALAILAAGTSQVPAATLFDPLALLCDSDVCLPLEHGTVLYSDRHHLTVAGSLRLVDGFTEVLSIPTLPAASGTSAK